jgi:predicted amidohydrolase
MAVLAGSTHSEWLQITVRHEVWGISGGDEIKVLDTAFGKAGVAICYDSEFPLIPRRQVELGAGLILVPSCTDTLAGYHRVRVGCMARALENQCYVVHAPTVGEARWSQTVDINIGAAAVYTPMDRGCPDDGILAIGMLNAPQWVYAGIDPGLMAEVRRAGRVQSPGLGRTIPLSEIAGTR